MVDVCELAQARGRSLGMILNRPGNGNFNYPMDAEFADLISPWSTALKAYRWNWRASQALRAGGGFGNVWDLIWSGPIATIDEDISGNRMNVAAVGWLQRLDRRLLRRDKNYPFVDTVSTDDADIIFDLLSEANGVTAGEYAAGTTTVALPDGYVAHWPANSSPNTPTWIKQGAKLPDEGAGGATAYVARYRGKSFQKGQNILQGMTDMTEIESGCDILVDPATRELNIYRRMRKIRDDVIFGYNWGPNNIQDLGRLIDGTTQVNYHVSSGRPGTIPKYQDDTGSQDTFGLMEEMATLSDVADPIIDPHPATGPLQQQSPLWTFSAAEVALRAQPRQIFKLLPFPYNPNYGGVPEPFVDYKLGDQVRFSAKKPPRVNIENQGARVFGFNVTIDDNNNEKLGELQFAI